MSDHYDLGDFDFFRPDDLLYRYVLDCHMERGQATSASGSLKHWDKGLSCDWALLRKPKETAKTLPGSILKISVGKCRELGIEVRYCPVVEPSSPNYNLAHCLLFLPSDLKTKSEKAKGRDAFLAACVTERVAPPPKIT